MLRWHENCFIGAMTVSTQLALTAHPAVTVMEKITAFA